MIRIDLSGEVQRKKAEKAFYNAGYRARNREAIKVKARGYSLAWYYRNPDKVAIYKARHKDATRDGTYRREYGITLADYNAMLAAQDNCCAICRSTTPRTRQAKNFAVDHCHVTNKVRGLLCIRCNNSLGWYEKHVAELQAYMGGR